MSNPGAPRRAAQPSVLRLIAFNVLTVLEGVMRSAAFFRFGVSELQFLAVGLFCACVFTGLRATQLQLAPALPIQTLREQCQLQIQKSVPGFGPASSSSRSRQTTVPLSHSFAFDKKGRSDPALDEARRFIMTAPLAQLMAQPNNASTMLWLARAFVHSRFPPPSDPPTHTLALTHRAGSAVNASSGPPDSSSPATSSSSFSSSSSSGSSPTAASDDNVHVDDLDDVDTLEGILIALSRFMKSSRALKAVAHTPAEIALILWGADASGSVISIANDAVTAADTDQLSSSQRRHQRRVLRDPAVLCTVISAVEERRLELQSMPPSSSSSTICSKALQWLQMQTQNLFAGPETANVIAIDVMPSRSTSVLVVCAIVRSVWLIVLVAAFPTTVADTDVSGSTDPGWRILLTFGSTTFVTLMTFAVLLCLPVGPILRVTAETSTQSTQLFVPITGAGAWWRLGALPGTAVLWLVFVFASMIALLVVICLIKHYGVYWTDFIAAAVDEERVVLRSMHDSSSAAHKPTALPPAPSSTGPDPSGPRPRLPGGPTGTPQDDDDLDHLHAGQMLTSTPAVDIAPSPPAVGKASMRTAGAGTATSSSTASVTAACVEHVVSRASLSNAFDVAQVASTTQFTAYLLTFGGTLVSYAVAGQVAAACPSVLRGFAHESALVAWTSYIFAEGVNVMLSKTAGDSGDESGDRGLYFFLSVGLEHGRGMAATAAIYIRDPYLPPQGSVFLDLAGATKAKRIRRRHLLHYRYRASPPAGARPNSCGVARPAATVENLEVMVRRSLAEDETIGGGGEDTDGAPIRRRNKLNVLFDELAVFFSLLVARTLVWVAHSDEAGLVIVVAIAFFTMCTGVCVVNIGGQVMSVFTGLEFV